MQKSRERSLSQKMVSHDCLEWYTETQPRETFYLPVLTHIPPQSSIFLPTSVKIMLKNMNNQCLIVYYIQSTIKKGKQSQKSDIAELKQFEGKNCTWKCFPWVGFLYITQGSHERPFFEIMTSPSIFVLLYNTTTTN